MRGDREDKLEKPEKGVNSSSGNKTAGRIE
jgi:hypothetical protein